MKLTDASRTCGWCFSKTHRCVMASWTVKRFTIITIILYLNYVDIMLTVKEYKQSYIGTSSVHKYTYGCYKTEILQLYFIMVFWPCVP